VPGAGAENRGGLAPLGADALQGWSDDEHHQRDEEVEVDQLHPGQAEQAEVQVLLQPHAEPRLEGLGEHTRAAQHGHEEEGQGQPTEVGEDG